MNEKANHPVKSLEKSVDIIEALNRLHSAELREISAELDMNKSTIHNHLSTLLEQDYVVKDGNEYQLSLKFLHIGGTLRKEFEVFDAAKPRIDQLALNTGELVTLATPDRGLAVILYRAKGKKAVDIDTHVGGEVTLHNSALGKAILAHLSRPQIEKCIEKHGLPAVTPNTITDRETLYDELETIRERGYAFDDEERWRGLRCIGLPILTDDGDVKGAISLSAPKSRMDDDTKREEYVDAVQNTANIIELSVTYS